MPNTAAELQIHADVSVLAGADGQRTTLALSPRLIAGRHWPDGRPGALQLEQAIEDVENAIEASGLVHADRGVLQSGAALCAMLPHALQAPGNHSRDAVEGEFSRLVRASGSANATTATADDDIAAAALLMVRELMHHLGFESLQTAG